MAGVNQLGPTMTPKKEKEALLLTPPTTKSEMAQRIVDLERKLVRASAQIQTQQSMLKSMWTDLRHALSFEGLLLKALTDKGVISEQDLSKTAEEIRKKALFNQSLLEASEKKVAETMVPPQP